MGTHLRVLSENYSMNTNMTGFRWLSKVVSALEGLNCVLFFVLCRSETAPPAGDDLRPECQVSPCGHLSGRLHRHAATALQTLRSPNLALPAQQHRAAQQRPITAQHHTTSLQHAASADTGCNRRVKSPLPKFL